MTKREAERIARDMERHGLTVTGFRRWTSPNERVTTWSVDVTDTMTGIPFVIDRAEQWEERREAFFDTRPVKLNGRPPKYSEPMERRTVRLLPAQWAWVEAQGKDANDGLRNVVQQAMEQERAEAEADAMAPTYNGGVW